MSKVHDHIKMLGFKVEDKVTGFKGVATSVSFDLYGCIQVIVVPYIGKDGKTEDGRWFDIARLKIASKSTVMDVPDFEQGQISEGKKGPSEKPCHNW